MNLPRVLIYSDGACSPNPGIGGWGAILISQPHDVKKEISGAEPESTNNRMELTAAMMALRTLKKPCEVTLVTDSEYLKNPFDKGWLEKWTTNGWRTSSRKPVLNTDLWQELLALTMDKHHVTWKWVRGHADDAQNNRCDFLAKRARQQLAKQLAGD
ncbi:MAG: ribonuclease HI [Anaerolineae bacterium]|nr:ribonuclease HI [Phycisphaerae bacterium]